MNLADQLWHRSAQFMIVPQDSRNGKKTKIKVQEVCRRSCELCSTPIPTELPTSRTTPPQPTPAPSTTEFNSDSCCSLDYKNCIDWCGEDYDSCINCAGDNLGWISKNTKQTQCVKRWVGCDKNNGTNQIGCCKGLTCQTIDGGWSSCQPMT